MNDNKNCKHGKVFTCRRLRMLNYLRDRGFIPFKSVPEINNPKYYNWLFYNSPELEQAINEWFEMQRNR